MAYASSSSSSYSVFSLELDDLDLLEMDCSF